MQFSGTFMKKYNEIYFSDYPRSFWKFLAHLLIYFEHIGWKINFGLHSYSFQATICLPHKLIVQFQLASCLHKQFSTLNMHRIHKEKWMYQMCCASGFLAFLFMFTLTRQGEGSKKLLPIFPTAKMRGDFGMYSTKISWGVLW